MPYPKKKYIHKLLLINFTGFPDSLEVYPWTPGEEYLSLYQRIKDLKK